MLRRLDNVGIAVRDVKRVVDFYVTKLGFQGEAGASDASIRLGDVSLYVFRTESTEAAGPRRTIDLSRNPAGIDHLAFQVDDVEAASRELEARGIVFPGPIVGAPGEFRYRGFADPEGNMLYVIQRP